MNPDAYGIELAADMEAGSIKNYKAGEHCHSLAEAHVASLAGSFLPEDIEGRGEYDGRKASNSTKSTIRPANRPPHCSSARMASASLANFQMIGT